MDGTQTPGINFNSIDGLTTVNATTITVNGSTINLDSYIPYVGAVSNPDFNTKILRNIGNAVNPQDAVAFSQLGTYVPYTGATSNVNLNAKQLKNILNASDPQDAVALSQLGSYIPYTGAVSNPDFNTRRLTNIGDALAVNDAVSLQQLNAYQPTTIINGAATVYAACGLTDLTLQADATGFINIGSIIDCRGNSIINLAAAINAGDAVRYDQLPAALPLTTTQGSYVIYNGTSYINNSTNSINLGAYSNGTATSTVNIGEYAGYGNTSANSHIVNIGQSTGSSGQNSQTVAVGSNAGATNQGFGSVAIGYRSQRTNTVGGYGSVSIGSLAGANDVGNNCVGVGGYAGYTSQGNNAVAIGYQAGYNNQSTNTIIINATGSQLNSAVSSATYVAPVRILTSENTSSIRNKVTQYDTLTNELRYSGTTIFNVIVIGLGAGVAPSVSFMPTGFPIDLFGFTFTCTVVRNSIGDYTLTFPASSGPNLLTATITTGVNALITAAVGGSKIVTAIATASNTIRINYVFANVAFTDLASGEYISLRIEFTTL